MLGDDRVIFTREQLMIHVTLLTLEMERGTSWELELGIYYVFYYVLNFYLELLKAFGINYLYDYRIEQ